MSSSRIIRKAGEPQRPFTLEPLGGPLASQEPEGFRPILLGGGAEEGEPEVEEEPAPPPCMPEEEALRRIRQAHADGFREGKEQAQGELATVSGALAQALLATGSLRGKLLHEAEEDLLKLSVLIARRVILRELALDPGIMAGVVAAALELAASAGEVVLRLNPEDHQAVAQAPEFRELLAERSQLRLIGDPSIGRAGCLLETSRGNIDAGIDAQLDDLLRRLLDEKNARREEPRRD